MVFALPTGSELTQQTAPAAAPVMVAAERPAVNGPLQVEQPLPNAVVSGKVTIRAQLLGARDFDYVAISVDGRVQAITNREPYYAVWDSTNAVDGPHELVVRAVGAREVLVRLNVTLRNKAVALAAGRGNPYDLGRYRELTGWQAPAAGGPRARDLTPSEREADREARLTISAELGHEREQITVVYLGR